MLGAVGGKFLFQYFTVTFDHLGESSGFKLSGVTPQVVYHYLGFAVVGCLVAAEFVFFALQQDAQAGQFLLNASVAVDYALHRGGHVELLPGNHIFDLYPDAQFADDFLTQRVDAASVKFLTGCYFLLQVFVRDDVVEGHGLFQPSADITFSHTSRLRSQDVQGRERALGLKSKGAKLFQFSGEILRKSYLIE